MQSSGQSDSILVNMAVYILVIGLFLLFILILVIVMFFEKLKPKVVKILQGIKEKTFWNNTIRSVTITYLETMIQLSI